MSWPTAIEPTKSLRYGRGAVCVQHMCMFKLTSRFSRLKTCHYLIRDIFTLLFLIISVLYSVQSNNLEGLHNSLGLCYCFPGHCNKFRHFPGSNSVCELSYGEHSRLKLSFKVWDAARVLFRKEKTEIKL